MKPDKKLKQTKTKNKADIVSKDHKFITETINKLVISPNFGKEYRIMRNLLKKYPDKRIWSYFDKSCDTLLFYYTEKGKNEIMRVQKLLSFDLPKTPEPVKLENRKRGGSIKVKSNLPPTLKDFLTDYINDDK